MLSELAELTAQRNAHQQAALAAERAALSANQAREGAAMRVEADTRRAEAAAVLAANQQLAAERKAAQNDRRKHELADARAGLERGGFAARFGTSLV